LKYYSNGKILLTSEYLVLDGALALSLPTNFGQYLEVNYSKSDTKNSRLIWKSLDEDDNCWFECEFLLYDFSIISKNDFYSEKEIAKKLQEILIEVRSLNSKFLVQNKNAQVISKVTFPLNWGLGTSSTLINNIAQWGKVDAYKLQFKVFGGSAYDIACAQNNSPILYKLNDKKPIIKPVFFDPKFKNNLYFIHLNVKKNSRNAIKYYKKNTQNKEEYIKIVSDLTKKMLKKSLSMQEFEQIITEHETVLSSILNIKTVKETLFKDYFGQIKSLGAWGGDFILATGNTSTPVYFKEKGFTTILNYNQMIKKPIHLSMNGKLL
jgi:mevalonate kinase